MTHARIRLAVRCSPLMTFLLVALRLPADEPRGVGYVSAPQEAPLLAKATGADPVATLKGSTVLLGYHTWSGNGKEQVKDGRVHVKYYVNGRDDTGGAHTGWVAEYHVTKFWFECCGTAGCSGVEAKLGSFPLSQCVLKAAADVVSRREQAGTSAQELERLRLQLEIEKLRLEQERLKAQRPPSSAAPSPIPEAPPPSGTPLPTPPASAQGPA